MISERLLAQLEDPRPSTRVPVLTIEIELRLELRCTGDRTPGGWGCLVPSSLKDGTNSIRVVVDEAGAVVATHDYDAFGNILAESTPTGGGGQPWPFEHRAFGELYDRDLGMVFLRARWMDPGTGTFISRDPFGGRPCDPRTLHRYVFVANDPINLSDPSGEDFGIGTVLLATLVVVLVATSAQAGPDDVTGSKTLVQVAARQATGAPRGVSHAFLRVSTTVNGNETVRTFSLFPEDDNAFALTALAARHQRGSAMRTRADQFDFGLGKTAKDASIDRDAKLGDLVHSPCLPQKGESPDQLIECFEKETKNYPEVPYKLFSGPNSNTFAATLAKRCCLKGFPIDELRALGGKNFELPAWNTPPP